MNGCNLIGQNAEQHAGAADDPLLSTEDLARIYRTTKAFWEQLRTQGAGPDFIKMGRLVRYRQSAINRYLSERTVSSTTAARHLGRKGRAA